MNLRHYLSETDQLVSTGEFAQALERYQWFHHHALEHQRSMYGVRLSYALEGWYRLAEQYPPALAALQKTRDQKRTKVQPGLEHFELFHDVTGINQVLGEEQDSISLFEQLEKAEPGEHQVHWHVLLNPFLQYKRADLLGLYQESLSSQMELIIRSFRLICEMENPSSPSENAPREAGEDYFRRQASELIQVAQFLRETELETSLRTQAYNVLPHEDLKP